MEVIHMSGAGNSFMVIDVRGQTLDFPTLSRSLCAMAGTDGMMAADRSEIADFKIHFYNSDGSRGEMCGNGARCICKFAYEQGLAGETMTVETDAGIVYAVRLAENRYRIRLNNPGIVDLHRRQDAAYVELGSPGVPHCVSECPDLQWEDRDMRQQDFLQLRYAPEFPKGVNVNMYRQLDSTRVRILTFERYVEDYTLACGTGSASVAVVLWLQGKLPGGFLTVENPGGTLEVTVEGQNGQIAALWLEGPAEIVQTYDIAIPADF